MNSIANTATQNSVKYITSCKVQNALPKVLVDYLWTILSFSGNFQSIKLNAGSLSGKEIQDIEYGLPDSPQKGFKRVFGFTPVCAELCIIQMDNGYYMELAEEALHIPA